MEPEEALQALRIEKFYLTIKQWSKWLVCFSLFCCTNQDVNGIVGYCGAQVATPPQNSLGLNARLAIYQKVEVKEPLVQGGGLGGLPISLPGTQCTGPIQPWSCGSGETIKDE